MKHRLNNQRGFTIIELMIATAAFSVLLLVCLVAISYIGRLYYKGVTNARTQEVARTTLDSISQAIQFSGKEVKYIPVQNNGTGWAAYCIGSQKYSFRLNTQLVGGTPGTGTANEVLVLSEDPSCIGSPSTVPVASSAKELLGTNMRLLALNIVSAPNAGNLYNVNIAIAYGGNPAEANVDQSTFDFNGPGGTISTCKTGAPGTQFCNVTRLNTTVFRKVQ